MDTRTYNRSNINMVEKIKICFNHPVNMQELADILFKGFEETTKTNNEPPFRKFLRKTLVWMSKKLDKRSSKKGKELSIEVAEFIIRNNNTGNRLENLLKKDILTQDEELEIINILNQAGEIIITSDMER